MDTPLSQTVKVEFSRGFGPEIYVPKAFQEKNDTTHPMWIFKPYEIRYLDALHRGEDMAKAMAKAGITEKQAKALLTRTKTREYMSQLLRQKMAAEGLTQDWFLSELRSVWDGTKIITRQQMEAIKEIGARVAPRPEKSSSDSTRPVININVDMAQNAIKRQQVIEGQLIGPKRSDDSLPGSLQEESALPV